MNGSSQPRMLVTGVSGLLGSRFVKTACSQFDVYACYGNHHTAIEQVRCFPLDLRVPEQVTDTLNRTRPTSIIHFAALTDVDYCESHPQEALEVNVECTERLASWAAANGCKFVYMSTDSVFDGNRGFYEETDAANPVNIYARTKLAAEELIQTIAADSLIIRSNIYGWNIHPKLSLAEWVLRELEANRSIRGFTDVVFSPLLTDTLSEIVMKMLSDELVGVYHVASSDSISKYDFARQLAREFGYSAELIAPILMPATFKAARPRNTSLNSAKLQAAIDGKLPSIAEDIARFKFMRSHHRKH